MMDDFNTLIRRQASRRAKHAKALFLRRRQGATYRTAGDHTPQDKRHGRGIVWVVGLAGLLTTVTIASITTRDPASKAAAEDILVTPPAQTLSIAGAAARLADYLPRPTASGTGGEAQAHQWSTRPVETDPEAWSRLTVRRGDTLTRLLRRHGVNPGEISVAINEHPQARMLYRLFPGEVIKVRRDRTGRLQELEYQINEAATLHITRGDEGFTVKQESREFETRLAYTTGVIESSLFEAGQTAGLADALIIQLVEIFGWDIDFALDLRRGDSFSVIHEEKFWLGQKVADGRILAAEFINQGRTYRAIAHQGKDGFTAYYTPDGMSMQQEFLRTPVKFSRISSRFSKGRYHPILKRWRRHTGVDYAAPTGTPVRATAAGRILSMGWRGGYGKTVVIKHGGNYSTLYAHLHRYNRSIRAGSYVEQGQIIGYVGKTGLATGPHLHYEFQVNGAHRNPLTFKFPRAKAISAEYSETFMKEVQKWSAKLNLIGRNMVAMAASGQQ